MTERTTNRDEEKEVRTQQERLYRVVWLSDKAYTVDALAVRGDEGRVSLRKAVVSRQNAFEPQMSEWGNPPIYRYR